MLWHHLSHYTLNLYGSLGDGTGLKSKKHQSGETKLYKREYIWCFQAIKHKAFSCCWPSEDIQKGNPWCEWGINFKLRPQLNSPIIFQWWLSSLVHRCCCSNHQGDQVRFQSCSTTGDNTGKQSDVFLFIALCGRVYNSLQKPFISWYTDTIRASPLPCNRFLTVNYPISASSHQTNLEGY